MKTAVTAAMCMSFALGVWADQPIPQSSQKAHRRFEVRITGWGAGRYLSAVENIPASLRQMPGHPDDPWRNQVFTIPGSTLNPDYASAFAAGVLLPYKLNDRWLFRPGIHWSFLGIAPNLWIHPIDAYNNTDSTNVRGINQVGFPF